MPILCGFQRSRGVCFLPPVLKISTPSRGGGGLKFEPPLPLSKAFPLKGSLKTLHFDVFLLSPYQGEGKTQKCNSRFFAGPLIFSP